VRQLSPIPESSGGQGRSNALPARAREGPPDSGETVVALAGVCKRYVQEGRALDASLSVTLRVRRGTIQGVIGSSGAGKTTLLRCISGLERPDSGRILIDGADVSDMTGVELRSARRRIGVVFQQFHLLQSRTAAENIGFPLEIAGAGRAEIRGRVAELLLWFGLDSKGADYPAQLSGGQQQRVAIARALANRPAVLLTDEPTSALDPETTASVLDLLRHSAPEPRPDARDPAAAVQRLVLVGGRGSESHGSAHGGEGIGPLAGFMGFRGTIRT
jgi:D-methionine transport system ATP-binding protein